MQCTLGIGGVIVTVCTSCNVSRIQCMYCKSTCSITKLYVRMCTIGNVGKRIVSTVSNCVVSIVRTCSFYTVKMCT